MRDANGHAVDELVAIVRVDSEAHLAVSRNIDEGGGSSLERLDCIVGDGAAVDPETVDELGVPHRCQPHELDSLALRQQEGRGDRGLAEALKITIGPRAASPSSTSWSSIRNEVKNSGRKSICSSSESAR